MFGLELTDDIPFSDVNVHPMIQAPDGRRMSKSLGTGIDPLSLIDGGPRPPVFEQGGEFPAYGADAVRFGLLAMSSSQDVRFNEDKVAQGRQLTNKLWNASRLLLLRVPDELPEPRAVTVEDAWILSRLQRAKAATETAFEDFEFHRAALGLYDFVYGDLCDWYLELIKPRLYAEDNAEVSAVALHVLRETLALAHPVIPFVTEEIWSYLPGSEDLLMAGPWPAPDDSLGRQAAEAELGARDRRGPGAARVARPRRRRAGPRAGGAPGGRGLRAHRRRRRPAGARRVDRQRDGARRHRPRPGRQRRDPRLRRGRHRGRGPPRDGGADAARGRDRARRGQARQPGLRRQGAAAGGRRRAREARAPAGRARGARMSWTLEQARGAPALARAVRHEVRPRAHAPPADRAGEPAARVPRHPRRRHQRQELDRPDGGGDPRRPRRAHGRLPLAAPDHVRRAHPHRRRRRRAGRVRRRGRARRDRGGQGRPHALGRRAGDAVRAADRRRVLRARRARGRGRGGRGRPRRPPRRHQRARRAGRGAHQRRARAHALARADDRRHRA